MTEENRGISPSKCEEVLKRVKGVVAARVVTTADGTVEEIHVLAEGNRAAKYIVRDIESAIIAAFGVSLDRRKVSVAQLGGEAAGRVPQRVQLKKVEIVSSSEGAEIGVQLGLGTRTVTGSEKGMPTLRNWLLLAAGATIKALSQFTAAGVCFSLQDVTVTTIRSLRVALVSVVISASGHDQLVTGSCPVSQDDREAVVKATLDALNRRFSGLVAQ